MFANVCPNLPAVWSYLILPYWVIIFLVFVFKQFFLNIALEFIILVNLQVTPYKYIIRTWIIGCGLKHQNNLQMMTWTLWITCSSIISIFGVFTEYSSIGLSSQWAGITHNMKKVKLFSWHRLESDWIVRTERPSFSGSLVLSTTVEAFYIVFSWYNSQN